MSNVDKWKQEVVAVLEELKHRPSKEARDRAEGLLRQVQRALNEEKVGRTVRRVAELTKAIVRYDRNTGRR